MKTFSSLRIKDYVTTQQSLKEAFIGQLFFAGAVQHLSPKDSICPELSRIFPDEKEEAEDGAIKGRLDFFINGNLCWGIELLVEGRKRLEHIARFSPEGKYAALHAKQWCVLDFRFRTLKEKTLSGLPPQYIPIVFSKDFLNATIRFPSGQKEVSLST